MWYRKAAEQGHSDAQERLGHAYYHGEGVTQDYEVGVTWLLKAAEQGEADAQYLLGEAYYHGKGVAQDREAAVRWYRKADGLLHGLARGRELLGRNHPMPAASSTAHSPKEAHRLGSDPFL